MFRNPDTLSGKSDFETLLLYPRNEEVPEDVLINAAKENPYATLAHLIPYRGEFWAHKGIIKAIREDSFAALVLFPRYQDQQFYYEEAEKAAKALAEEHPRMVIAFFHYYERQRWAREVRAMAEDALSNRF